MCVLGGKVFEAGCLLINSSVKPVLVSLSNFMKHPIKRQTHKIPLLKVIYRLIQLVHIPSIVHKIEPHIMAYVVSHC